LTGLRFVAAAGIVFFHSGWFGRASLRVHEVIDLNMFVDLFFLLSGFILTYVYPKLETAGDRARFLLARFARLWPAHALGLVLVGLLIMPPTAPVPYLGSWSLAALNLAMLHSWIPVYDIIFSYNGPSWSISTEFGFYICFLFLIPRWERTWHVKLVLTSLLACLLPGWLCQAGLLQRDGPSTALTAVCLGHHPLTRVFEFALGMATALLWRKQSPRLRLGPLAGTLVEFAATALAAASMYRPLWTSFIASVKALYPQIGEVGTELLIEIGKFVPFALLIAVLANEWGDCPACSARGQPYCWGRSPTACTFCT
jgi:peptidoglycan/LPS O-acetylase OafA/YrhL